MLVIDVTKGIQTQTAECLVLGEITCDHMLLVLNKIDLLPDADRAKLIDKVTLFYSFTLSFTLADFQSWNVMKCAGTFELYCDITICAI